MKKLSLLTIMFAVLIAATFAILGTSVKPASAAAYGNNAFALYSGASGTVRTSAAMSVRGYKVKTLTVTGATLASNATTATFKNMSGTVLAECSPTGTTTGPWSTCVDPSYAQTAVSKTTNGTMTWTDSAAYIRLKWTASTVGTKLKAFFNWTE